MIFSDEETEKEPLLKMIKTIGHWPLLEGKDWIEKNWDWKGWNGTITKLHEYLYKKTISRYQDDSENLIKYEVNKLQTRFMITFVICVIL
jgi:hypothetical protein